MEFCKIEQQNGPVKDGRERIIVSGETQRPNSNGINKSWIHRRKRTATAKLFVEKTMDPRCSYLGFVGVHQRGAGATHGAAPGSGQEGNIWLWGFSGFSSNMCLGLVDSTSGTTEFSDQCGWSRQRRTATSK